MSLYRKYRPQTFGDVVGQQHVSQTLTRAIELDRLTHAYLFTGPRGTGKTSLARILAKAINCTARKGSEPCNECEICKDITDGRLVDLIEIDAASNRGIDEIRELREKIAFAPTRAAAKVYIIDEVHMLTKEAFNALLKTLEEPPPHVYFILATTEVHKIPETILSRCQRFDFRRISEQVAIDQLKMIAKAEGIETEEEALNVIVHHADGGMRDAIGLLEQLANEKSLKTEEVCTALGVSGATSLEKLYKLLEGSAVGDALQEIKALHEQGHDLYYFNKRFLEFLRRRMHDAVQQNDGAKIEWLLGVISNFQRAYEQSRYSPISQLPLEIATVKSCSGASESASLRSAPAAEAQPAQRKQAGLGNKPENKSVAAVKESASLRSAQPTTKSEIKDPDSPLSIEEVQSAWEKILETVANPIAKTSLRQAKPLRVEGAAVVVGFANRFHVEKISEGENKIATEKAIYEVLGHELKVLMEVVAAPENFEKAENPTKNPENGANPPEKGNNIGDAVMDMFEGEIV